jgi:ligand-binding sensor domain-containing protein
MTKYILFFIGCCILFAPLRSQNVEPIKFVHIGLNEGLSQSTIFGITQDKQGNMWFATYNGLNKYNGYDFTVYQHDEHNPHSISNDIIRSCTADRLGKIWIGTDSGLSFYNADKDRFENFSSEDRGEQVPINGIVEFNDHELLLFSNKKKLLLFNTETSQFSCKMPESSLESLSPTVVARQGDYIYIGSNNKVYTYSLAANTLSSFVLSDNLKDKNITAILQQSPTRIWIGTEGGGLFLYNPQTGTIKNYSHTSKTANCISSDYVRSLALDSQHRLWIGTINSLNIYNEQEDNFNIYTSDPLENGSLSQMSVRNIFMDTQGGMWLGTYFGGINYYHPLKNRFRNLQFTAKPNSLNSNIINCIREDAQKGLWIGTNGGGVNYYNPQTGKFTHYTQKEGLGSNDVKAIYIDEANKQVYIGTHTGGLSILHRRSGQIETYNRNSREKNIYAIEPTETGDFWMSGMSSILRFNPSQLSFSSITTQSDGRPFLRERVSNFFRDSKHRLWLISEKGLFAYTEQNGKLHNYPIPALDSISRKFINCLYEAHDGTFWIGTRSGICRLNEKSQEVTLYTTAHGLPNNVVHGILEDSYGKLWISTDKGISCLHPSTGKFRNFTNNDGLQSNQFTAACQRTADGQMYFGGINGITTFRPEEVVDNPYIPPVVITQLRLFNKIVFPDDETGILERNINETRSITFTAQQSMFSLEFVVSNYASGTHNTFAYKLDGYDKEWYYTNSQRVVSYSNLPQGTYRFLVKAANNDGKWNETPTELEIIILPAWYKTWWASLLFAAAFIAATVFVFRYFWIRKSMKAEIQMAQIDKERQKEVNEMKLRFFINISHELRTLNTGSAP